MNICLFMGYIATDIVLKPVGDTVVANFRLHLVRKYKKKDGETHKENAWIDCEVWDSAAKTISTYFKKGSKIAIKASVKQQNWEKDGQKRSKLIHRIDEFYFVDSPPQQQDDVQAEPRVSVNSHGEDIPF
jgi:single-strand DNA-binding protein